MAQYTTSQEAMQQGAAKVDQATQDILGILSRIDADAQTMLGGWRSEASGQFVKVHEQFQAEGKNIAKALGDMYYALTGTHETYSRQEQNQAQAIGGLSGLING